MKSLSDLIAILDETGYPVAFSSFSSEGSTQAPALPYIIVMDPSSDNMFADNTVYVQIDEYRVELYAEHKSTAIEKVLEDVFKTYEIPWNKDSDYIESEKMNRTSYYIEI